MPRKLVNSETSWPPLFNMKVHCGTSQPAVPSKLSPSCNLTASYATQAEVHPEILQPAVSHKLKSTLKSYSQLCHTSWSPFWNLTASCATQAEVHPEILQPAVPHKLKSTLKSYSQLCRTSWSPFWNLTASCDKQAEVHSGTSQPVCHTSQSLL